MTKGVGMGALELLAWGAVALWVHAGGWEVLAWGAVAFVSLFRIAMAIGFIAVTVAIVRGVRASQPVPQEDQTRPSARP